MGLKTLTKKISRKRLIYGLIALVAVGGLSGFGIYYFIQYKRVVDNPSIVSKQETQDVVSAVRKLMELPTDETPTLATVQDKDKLKDQPFFAAAQNGDKILIYTKAKKAIVYRQKDSRIINVGPILLDQTSASAKVELINGGSGTSQTESTLASQFKDKVTVYKKADAAKSYSKTKVIDTKGAFSSLAASLAEKLNGEVSKMPDGETADGSADIIVIVGSDQ